MLSDGGEEVLESPSTTMTTRSLMCERFLVQSQLAPYFCGSGGKGAKKVSQTLDFSGHDFGR